SVQVSSRQQSAGRGLNKPRPMKRPPASTRVTTPPGATPSETSATSPLKIHGCTRARSRPRLSRNTAEATRSAYRSGKRTRRDGLAAAPQDHDHQQRMPRLLEDLVGLEAEKPLHELEAAREGDQRLDLLREEHARQVRLPVHAPAPVLDPLEHHPLAEDLGH